MKKTPLRNGDLVRKKPRGTGATWSSLTFGGSLGGSLEASTVDRTIGWFYPIKKYMSNLLKIPNNFIPIPKHMSNLSAKSEVTSRSFKGHQRTNLPSLEYGEGFVVILQVKSSEHIRYGYGLPWWHLLNFAPLKNVILYFISDSCQPETLRNHQKSSL